jgi:hypothetical protein
MIKAKCRKSNEFIYFTSPPAAAAAAAAIVVGRVQKGLEN